MILEVKNLKKDFSSQGLIGKKKLVQALKGISFHLAEKETLAIVGESGCGKSTLAKVLLKMESPTEGQVKYDSKSLELISNKELSSVVQMVFQDPYSSINPRKKIYDIIGEPLKILGINKNDIFLRVSEMAEKVGLRREILDRYPHMLSGGQRQRIGIARALITNPKIVICDEPVSALDVSVQAQVLNLLMDLQEEFGLSYVFISHDLSVVRFIADRILVMNLGEIVEQGSRDDVFLNPKNDYTKALLQALPKIEV